MAAIKCFMTVFILAQDGTKGLKEKQKIAEGVLSKRGYPVERAKTAENGRRKRLPKPQTEARWGDQKAGAPRSKTETEQIPTLPNLKPGLISCIWPIPLAHFRPPLSHSDHFHPSPVVIASGAML
jgi:hypothetical protein